MRIDFEEEQYLKGCIKTCQGKGHIQQVAFSTYHNALTQVCFTCNVLRTSIKQLEVYGSKKAKSKPLNYFKENKNAI